VKLAHFLDVYNPKMVYRDFHVNLSLNNLRLQKEEKTPVANSFPKIVDFLGVSFLHDCAKPTKIDIIPITRLIDNHDVRTRK
jgi:hypothetical protein